MIRQYWKQHVVRPARDIVDTHERQGCVNFNFPHLVRFWRTGALGYMVMLFKLIITSEPGDTAQKGSTRSEVTVAAAPYWQSRAQDCGSYHIHQALLSLLWDVLPSSQLGASSFYFRRPLQRDPLKDRVVNRTDSSATLWRRRCSRDDAIVNASARTYCEEQTRRAAQLANLEGCCMHAAILCSCHIAGRGLILTPAHISASINAHKGHGLGAVCEGTLLHLHFASGQGWKGHSPIPCWTITCQESSPSCTHASARPLHTSAVRSADRLATCSPDPYDPADPSERSFFLIPPGSEYVLLHGAFFLHRF